MKKTFLALALILFAVFVGAFIADENPKNNSLKEIQESLSKLQKKVDKLTTLNTKVTLLENQIAELRTEVISSDGNSEVPISPATFKPNDSYLDDPFLGLKDSEIIIMSFINYQCGPCRIFKKQTFPKLKKDFIDTKKVKFILRDFPLSTNKYSFSAAQLAHCAGEQGHYWEIFEALFNHEEEVDNGHLLPLLTNLADVNHEKAEHCFDSKRYVSEIKSDILDGKKLGAKGAPGFFIGKLNEKKQYEGVFIRGAQPYPVIRNQIERFL